MKKKEKKIAIVTDAWDPQVNGVVRTLKKTGHCLLKEGYDVKFITPEFCKTVPCPSYPEIRLALLPGNVISREIEKFNPHAIHIATEGPVGHAGRAFCKKNKIPFTTSFHTQFPEYLNLRTLIPISWTYSYLRRFHNFGKRILVPSKSRQLALESRGFKDVVVWSRGVDIDTFNAEKPYKYNLPRPLHIYMGRVAVEKNIEAFLRLNLPGSQVVIGDGPDLAKLKKKYQDAHFLGAKFGQELGRFLAGGDCFVFPSKTDTFGLVLLEAMACGLPVAAYPVEGPIDIVLDGKTGALNQDLKKAIKNALLIERQDCQNYARGFTWESCTKTFESNLCFNNDGR